MMPVTLPQAVKLAAENTQRFISYLGVSQEGAAEIVGISRTTFVNAISNASSSPGERGNKHVRRPQARTTRQLCFNPFLPEEVRHSWIIVHFYERLWANQVQYSLSDFPRWFKPDAIAA